MAEPSLEELARQIAALQAQITNIIRPTRLDNASVETGDGQTVNISDATSAALTADEVIPGLNDLLASNEDALAAAKGDIEEAIAAAQEASDAGIAAGEQASAAADEALANADTANTAAQDAKDRAAAAKSAADAAGISAGNAQSTADTAKSTADQAQSTATGAQTTADNAQTTANTAKTTADQAKSAADTAGTQANAAKTAADAAQADATSAKTAADNANTAALNAAGIANGKGKVIYSTTAPTGDDRATTNLWIDTSGSPAKNTPNRWNGSAWVAVTDKAATDAASAASAAQTSANNAQTTANNAKTAADNAASAASTAQSAANAANTAAQAADTKAVNAQNAADAAKANAATAQTAADLAKAKADAATANAVNVIADPSFENPALWPGLPSRFSIATDQRQTGQRSLKVIGGSVQSVPLASAVPVRPGQTWRIRASRLTTSDYNGTPSNGKIRLGDQGNAILAAQTWDLSTTWGAIPEIIYTVPANGSVTALNLAAFADHGTGTLWIDDVELVNITDAKAAIDAAATAQTAANAAKTAADNAQAAANSAASAASAAQNTANGKNQVTYSTATPSNTTNPGTRAGDIWFVRNASGWLSAQYEWSGTAWTLRNLDSAILAYVDAGKITAGTISADRIGANSITAAKLATDSVTSNAILAGTIQAVDIATGTITGDRIAAATLTASLLMADTLTSREIGADAILARNIKAAEITGTKIAARTIAAGNIVAGTITGNEIAANTITANLIQAGSITADKLSADAINGKTVTGVTVTGGRYLTATDARNRYAQLDSGILYFRSASGPYGESQISGGGGATVVTQYSPVAGDEGSIELRLDAANYFSTTQPAFLFQGALLSRFAGTLQCDTLDVINTGTISAKGITLTGSLAAASATLTGSLSAASLSASGQVSGSSFNGGSARLTATGDASLTSGGHAFQIGPTNGVNIIMDQNELMARDNGGNTGLYLNADGGTVGLGDSGSTINIPGLINNPNTPARVAVGTTTHTNSIAAGAFGSDQVITFPSGRFTSAPIVIANASNSRVMTAPSSTTATGTRIGLGNWSNGTANGPITVTWIAIQF